MAIGTDNLFAVHHDALLIAGAYGHGLIKELFFGSKLERIQSTLVNSMLIVGPNSAIAAQWPEVTCPGAALHAA